MRSMIFFGCLLVCLSVSHGAGQPVIRSLDIQGNQAFTERRLAEAIQSKPGATFSSLQLRIDVESLLALYHQSGYYDAGITADSLSYSDDSSFVDIELTIQEGRPSTVGNIELEGNTALSSDEIFQMFDTHTGDFLDPQILERDFNEVLSRYERIGYPFAKIDIQEISPLQDFSQSSIRIKLVIDEGGKVLINEIKVTGNKETKEDVIVRETRVRQGEIFDQDKISRIQQRLNRLNIFSSVQEPELYMNPSGGGLLITVQEGNTNTFDGVIGYVPGTGSGGTVTGLVNILMRNLFGTARKLNIHWQKEDAYSQEIGLRYVEPWVASLPVNLESSFFQRQQDTLYVRRNIETKADLLITESFSIGGLFNHESIIPSSTISGQVVFNSRTIMTGIEFQYDSRDDIVSPTGGVYYHSDYRIGNKKIFNLPVNAINIKENNTVQKVSMDIDFFVEPIVRQVVALGLHGRQLTSDQIEVGDLYRFGGTNTMRGYRESQFLGSRIAWTNTEYRFLLARRSFFYGFFDSGYYFLPGDDVKGISSIQHLKYGYGVGMRIETSLGNIGVSFAFGEGDSFSQGKIHFGLMNEF